LVTETDPRTWEQLLALTDPEDTARLYRQAYAVKQDQVGTKVYYRGIIEFSNVCTKDCFYCGIRRDNPKLKRYTMSGREIVDCAKAAWQFGYGSIVLQSGERSDPAFVSFVTDVLRRIHAETNGELGITLSLGEQTPDTYHRWFEAGARRYLIRIETSNRELYRKLHPEDHDFDRRLACLAALREIGFQVGTGVMIGLPGQTCADLARDIRFFVEQDVDMIGMGPYIPHHDTPMAHESQRFNGEAQLRLGLNMIAVTRIALQDVNIAATTALQALDPKGRELGLKAGANIIMPNITPTKYREGYQLYDGKPCLDENAGMCRFCLEKRIDSIGEEIGYREWGDSPHFLKKAR